METTCSYLPYENTHAFSKLVIDYIHQDDKLKPFYAYAPNMEGIKAAIEARRSFAGHRPLLVEQLRLQYNHIELSPAQEDNLQLLLANNCFTITTAHQPNIFTGPLYFIYKIAHTIRLAAELKQQLPENDFVPVYYMGSEDADLDELGHIWVDGEKLVWQTDQQGAVGRMHTKGLEKIMDRLEGEFAGLPFGQDMVNLIRHAYSHSNNIQQATLIVVNELFKVYGLLVLIPDNASLKKAFNPVVKKELLEQFSHGLVQDTIAAIGEHYKVQASGRAINLFYLNDAGRRERIELTIQADGGKRYEVKELALAFTEREILDELDAHPERFSANVILRGLFQETILPNIAFIGGGGELAYWLELKKVFEAAGIPYPVLLLRNSFLLINKKQQSLRDKLGISNEELFIDQLALINEWVKRSAGKKLDTLNEQKEVYAVYEQLQLAANDIDATLKAHIAALHVSTLKGLKGLEKKMLRAERRKHTDGQEQINKLKAALFPNGNLQERIDNFMPLYAFHGKALIDHIIQHSLAIESAFAIIEMQD